MGSWDKFCLLMWKNWKVQLRKPITFMLEMGIPIFIVGLFLIFRSSFEKEVEPQETFRPLPVNSKMAMEYFPRAYSPNTNTFLNGLMEKKYPGIIGKPNALELENFLVQQKETVYSVRTWIGIQFDDDLPDDPTQFSQNITIKLRYVGSWYTELVFPDFEIEYGYRGYRFGGPPSYYNKMFTTVMYQLTRDIFQEINKDVQLPRDINLRIFPHASFERDKMIEFMGQSFLFGILMMTAFLYGCTTIVKSITLEKEQQLKESMKIMGLPTWLHWTAWFLQIFIPFLVVGIIITITLKVGDILTFSDGSLVFIFVISYIIGLITFSFAVSVFFSKANRAASFAGIAWILTLMPYLLVRSSNYTSLPASGKYLTSLFITSGLSYGFDLISLYESRSIGIQWNNLFETSVENNFTFGGILLMMILDIFIYLFIALYVEQIFPGEFGVPQKWYFLFTKHYWCSGQNFVGRDLGYRSRGEYFEEEPTSLLKAGIKIEKLSKTFGANEVVKELSLNLYEDQISVLLGHNGAGKTTTMSMLTGMFPPTKGTATINGYDIRTQIMNVRDSMGLCPQHNVLFEDLTVKEHLQFFCKLKGTKGAEVDEEVNSFLKLLNLENKADEKSGALSGGMKRKLCVGIALCGNSKVIMLDEPTAGMDPSARRFIWEFLQKQKKGRTILLTTHFMDEADLLGDRIAIMSNGELKCCGSSFFLKKKFGTGYHLIIEQLPQCQPNNITNMLGRYIPHIEIHSNAGTELTYLLPEEYASRFPEMLFQLESSLDNLGIRSFGISLTDLEEVFMKVGTNKSGRPLDPTNNDTYNNEYTQVTLSSSSKMESGFRLHMNQVRAMASKKILSTMRTWLTELLKIVVPVLFIILVGFVGSTEFAAKIQDARSFTLEDYNAPITLIQSSGHNYEQSYKELLDSYHQKYEITENITISILNEMNKDPMAAKYRYIVGMSFEEAEVPTAWYNNEPYHSEPLSLQILLNSYLLTTKHQVNFVNYPLPDKGTEAEREVSSFMSSNGTLLALSWAVVYIGCYYILFNIKERVSRAKHLQFVSGINVFIFWFVSFIADLITFIVPMIIIIVTMVILKPSGMSTFTEISTTGLLLFCFCISTLPLMYAFSFLFTVPATGYSVSFFIGFITGFPAIMIVTVLTASNWVLVDELQWILRLIPNYDFSEAIYHVNNRDQCDQQFRSCGIDISIDQCKIQLCRGNPSSTCCTPENFMTFDDQGVLIQVLMSLVITFLTFSILFLTDLRVFTSLKYKIFSNKKRPLAQSNVDEDVRNEDNHVHSTPLAQLQSQYVLVLKDLMKTYKDLIAVNGLNLTVKKSECFGLLGENGAGKTTTFKMMTGDEMISFGDGWINGYSIRNQVKSVHKFIGYCPQFDALLDNLTARETLVIFSLIRGVPRDQCAFTAEQLAKDFDFTQHLDKQVKELSGGNKRKLSTSIALIGDAPIIFLDEPTTGMDPATKRHLWNQLNKIRQSGKSIILTSHSMEECEALCTRLVIMVNGNFQCLGSTQHLKSRFAEGFSIILKIRKLQNSSGFSHADTTSIERFMASKFPQSELREKHQELLNYYISDNRIKWSRLFAILEEARNEHDIEDYSVGQASLEQVFLTFTKDQATEKPKKTPTKFSFRCCKTRN